MNDYEYLQQAGIDPENGGAASSTPPPASSTPSSSESSSQQAPSSTSAAAAPSKSEAQKAQEMFELMGSKYPVDTKFKIPRGGKVLEVPYKDLVNTYGQAKHYQDSWNNEWKPKITEFEKLRPDFDRYKGFYDKYGGLQEWSEKNPDQWAVLWDLYQNKDKHLLAAQTGAQNPPAAQSGAPNLNPFIEKITNLEKQLSEKTSKYDEVLSHYEQSMKTRQEQEDTAQVKSEIEGVQKEFPDINLQERDPEGVALWAKIILWGQQRNYTDFDSAFRVYCKDRIRESYAMRTREEVLKSYKDDAKAGVIKRSATPITIGKGQPDAAKDISKMSYGEIAEMSKSQISNFG